MRISGHKTTSIFRRYSITDGRDLKQAAKLIEAGLETDTSDFAESVYSRKALI